MIRKALNIRGKKVASVVVVDAIEKPYTHNLVMLNILGKLWTAEVPDPVVIKRLIKLNIELKRIYLVDMLTRRKIYYIVDQTDCDHCRSVTARVAKNRIEYDKAIPEIYEWAEGQTYVCRVTKEEYEEHQDYHRDYIMEAYENGHPHTIRY